MSLARLQSIAFLGLDALTVDIEVDAIKTEEKQILILVGLPDATVKESKERVLGALKYSGYSLLGLYCRINLAPGDLRKEGAIYDLPIALGLLLSLGLLGNLEAYQDYLIAGELGLSGETRPLHGALAIAMHARNAGKKGVLLPAANAREAAAVPGLDIVPIHHLKEAVQFLQQPSPSLCFVAKQDDSLFKTKPAAIDFADIKGQAHVKRALEIAAAGAHNIAMSGPPGSGKTMLAKATVGIMPAMTVEESLETTRIHSIAGLLSAGQGLISQRPFRSPHHTVSYAGLIGGGAVPRPGEVSLAHHGILFLDELPEFSRMALEVLRQPLEDRKVTISRAHGNFTYPTNFICIAAMNPCPCGHLGNPEKPCKDTQVQVDRYRNKISGPLWDRFDMHVEVPALRYQDVMQSPPGESSAVIRARIETARQRQHQRYGKVKTNSLMTSADIKRYCPLDAKGQEILRHAMDVKGISVRAFDRLLRVARTIADLEGEAETRSDHLLEALNFRFSFNA